MEACWWRWRCCGSGDEDFSVDDLFDDLVTLDDDDEDVVDVVVVVVDIVVVVGEEDDAGDDDGASPSLPSLIATTSFSTE